MKNELQTTPLVTIVLPVYNDKHTVTRCITSLLDQSYKQKELVIIDDGSTDGTPAILKNFSNLEKVRIIRTPHKGRSSARNFGATHAKGSIIFFAEADAIYHPDYITRVIKHFHDPIVGGVMALGAVLEQQSLVQRCLAAEIALRNYKMATGKKKPISAWVYRLNVLKQAGGFDERLDVAEDRDLAMRVEKTGYSITVEPGVNWRHPYPKTILDFIRWIYRRSKSRATFQIKYRKFPIRDLSLLLTMIGWLILTRDVILLGLLVLIAFATKIMWLMKDGWGIIQDKEALLFLPLLGLMRTIIADIGLTIGLLTTYKSRTLI